ncbi:MAG: IS66 family transposase zinc-finger binding domain-containing protein [Gammaproteobacteria bacterium]|nr:IS66 family transposase zinc-finger binding domain-containing protein [Gammaproteobacteria bacterium]
MKPAPSPEVLAADNQRLRQALAEATARAEGLATQAEVLTAQAEALAAQIRELEAIRRDLEHQVALFKRCLFGSRSEKVSAEELEARIRQHAQEAREAIAQEKGPGDPPPEAEEERPEEPQKGGPPPGSTPAGKPPKRQARPHGRAPLPAHLPRRRIEHPIDPAQTTCPHCAGHPPLVLIGEDIREKLHKLPVQYEVHQHVYPKCACPRCHFGVVMPAGPDHGLKADITVVADVVVQKYAEHKPLYGVAAAVALGAELLEELLSGVGMALEQRRDGAFERVELAGALGDPGLGKGRAPGPLPDRPIGHLETGGDLGQGEVLLVPEAVDFVEGVVVDHRRSAASTRRRMSPTAAAWPRRGASGLATAPVGSWRARTW